MYPELNEDIKTWRRNYKNVAEVSSPFLALSSPEIKNMDFMEPVTFPSIENRVSQLNK